MNVRRHGFSLAELLVAMFVMTVGIAGVASTIYWGVERTDSGKYVTQASDLGRVLVETFAARAFIAEMAGGDWPDRSTGIFDDPEDRRPVFEPPFQDLAAINNLIAYDSVIEQRDIDKYSRNIRVERVAAEGTETGPPQNRSTYSGELARLVVKIYWNEKGHERNVAIETIIPHGL